MSADPGEGYRLLRDGEVKLDGDEYCEGFNNPRKHWRPCRDTLGERFDTELDWPTRRKRTPADDSIDRILTAMQTHPQWADILFGELTEPLRTDLKLVLEHYLGDNQ